MNTTWFFDPRFHVFQHDLSLAGMAAFAATIAIGLLISAIIQHEKIRLFLTRLGLDKNFVAIATGVVGLTLLISSIVVGLNLGGLPVHWEAPMPGIGISIGRLLRLVVTLVAVFWAVSSFKRFLFDRYLRRMGMDRALEYAIAQICGYFALVLGVFIVLQNAGIDLSALTIFAGAVGVGVGFGLQNVTSNFISGLVLAERPIKIGDRVQLDKVAGQITAIHARSTTVLTNDNIAIIVPNSHFIEKAVTNWSHADPKVRFRIPIGVAYGSEVEKVRELLLSIAREHPAALKEPEPVVSVSIGGLFSTCSLVR
jgi:small-conductance mechanosensitive channel